jgi:hypothetical protein
MHKREGTLCIFPCHGVYDPELDCFYGEHSEDHPIYKAQLFYVLSHLIWRAATMPLLVISGGLTKLQRRCSESRSHLEWVHALGWRMPDNVALEEHALTTPENVLLSLYKYRQVRGVYPERIEVIASWGFKEDRLAAPLAALNKWEPLGQTWTTLDFFPAGDLSGSDKVRALKKEAEYCAALDKGIVAYYDSPVVKEVIRKRDVIGSPPLTKEAYSGYPLPF